jgi:hypothetical protein
MLSIFFGTTTVCARKPQLQGVTFSLLKLLLEGFGGDRPISNKLQQNSKNKNDKKYYLKIKL